MKKLIIISVAFLMVNSAIAQTKIAIKAGWNYTTARVYDDGQKLSAGFKNGYGLGVVFKVPFEGVLHFSPSIIYNKRGYSYTPAAGVVTHFNNVIHYIDIIPALSIDLPIGNNSLVITVGPNFSAAISGKQDSTVAGITASSKMNFSLTHGYGFIDLGMNGSVGFHTKQFLVETGFQLGLANINNDWEADKRDIRNRMFTVQLGYYIK